MPYPEVGIPGAGNNEGILARARERETERENGEEPTGGKANGTFGRSREKCNEMLQDSQRDI